MARTVKLSDQIVTDALIFSKVSNRSISGQIEHWVKIGKIAEENSDLTYEFIKNTLVAVNESQTEELTYYRSKKQKVIV